MWFTGSTPQASNVAAISRVAALRPFGSWNTVMACRSTTHQMHSWSSCSPTQFRIAPR